METYRAYYEDTYLEKITAEVIGVTDRGVILDRTVCYPECGGQPGDRGTMNGIPFSDTQHVGDDIVHITDSHFNVGDRVVVELDWEHRYRYMKIHTAQHLLSGLMFSKFKIGTVSVHQGEKFLTIETDREDIDIDTCYSIVDEANNAINEGHRVHYREVSHREAEDIGLRRSIKVDGDVRLVYIDGVDVIACGGVHVANTDEIGIIQYCGQEKIRSHARLIFTVDDMAREDIRENREAVRELNSIFSSQTFELCGKAKSCVDELAALRSENASLLRKLASCQIRELSEEKDVVIAYLSDDDPELKYYPEGLIDGKTYILFHGDKWLFRSGNGEVDKMFNANRKELLSSFGAKGGGRPPLYQGVCDRGRIECFISLLKEKSVI